MLNTIKKDNFIVAVNGNLVGEFSPEFVASLSKLNPEQVNEKSKYEQYIHSFMLNNHPFTLYNTYFLGKKTVSPDVDFKALVGGYAKTAVTCNSFFTKGPEDFIAAKVDSAIVIPKGHEVYDIYYVQREIDAGLEKKDDVFSLNMWQ